MLVEKMIGLATKSKIILRNFAKDECHMQLTQVLPQGNTIEKL